MAKQPAGHTLVALGFIVRLGRPLQQLAHHFAPEPLAADASIFAPGDFLPYRTGGLGDAAIPLVSPGGAPTHDFALAGPARLTPAATRCRHLRAALAELGVPVARSRLVRLAARTSADIRAEWNYHWFRHLPICIPIQTDEAVTFQCGGEIARLAAGVAWIFDNSRPHALHNRSARDCLHLLVETPERSPAPDARSVVRFPPYRFEVLAPHELGALIRDIVAAPIPADVRAALAQIASRWEIAFARFGHDARGELAYQDLLLDVREQVIPHLLPLPPASAAARAAAVIDTMLDMAPPVPRRLHPPAQRRGARTAPIDPPEFDRPVFIVSAPRAGSTVLVDLVARFDDVFTLGGENHEIIRRIAELHPAARGFASDRLTAADAQPEVAAALRDGFARRLVDRTGRSYLDAPPSERPRRVRLVEKTPANALRIPFLRAVFPDARFVHLVRDPRPTISSLVEGWRSRRFVAYRGLPGWPYRDWSFFLPPGWESLVGCSLIEIAAHQWRVANDTIEQDLRAAPAGSSCKVDYDDLVRCPQDALRTIAELAELRWNDDVAAAVAAALPLSSVTLSAPAQNKWWRHEAELEALLPRASVEDRSPTPSHEISHQRGTPW